MARLCMGRDEGGSSRHSNPKRMRFQINYSQEESVGERDPSPSFTLETQTYGQVDSPQYHRRSRSISPENYRGNNNSPEYHRRSNISPEYHRRSNISPEYHRRSNSPENYRGNNSPENYRGNNSPTYSPENSPEPYYDDDDDDDDVEDDDVEGCNVMTLSDPEVLDCPICIDPLTVPVFQCENGHIACSACSTKASNKCPSCTLPIGYIRCRAIEKVIESVKISCQNFTYGCMEKTNYCNKKEHENTCTYSPCSCPHLYCSFKGSLNQVSAHFTSGHPNIAKCFHFDNTFSILINPRERFVILQENGGLLFILRNTEFQSLGNLISVSCIKPRTSKKEFSYNLVAKKGECMVKLESVADNVSTKFENPDKKMFLMVPGDFIDSSGKIKVEVNIFNLLPNTPPRVVNARLGNS